MSFLQAHQVLTYESTEIRVLGFLGEVGMTTPEDPGEYSRLSGAGPNRFVSGAALFLLSFEGLFDFKRSSKGKAHCIYPYSGREPQITVAVRCNRLPPSNGAQKVFPFRLDGGHPRRLVAPAHSRAGRYVSSAPSGGLDRRIIHDLRPCPVLSGVLNW